MTNVLNKSDGREFNNNKIIKKKQKQKQKQNRIEAFDLKIIKWALSCVVMKRSEKACRYHAMDLFQGGLNRGNRY